MQLKDIPNLLTCIRICLIPILVSAFYFEGSLARYVVAVIFSFASITDYIDGFLARLWKVQTKFGTMLDPIADKMLVASTLLMLVHMDRAPAVPIVAILCREIFVSGLREYLADFRISLPVSKLTKVKTVLQIFAILILLLSDNECSGIFCLHFIGQITIWLAAILTLTTGYSYLRESLKVL